MSLEVLNNPIFTTLQDKGRFNYSHLGVCVSGVMDEYSYNIAHQLLNNPQNTNILEIYFGNISFLSKADTTISITGAICEFHINDTVFNTWQTIKIKKGDIVKIGKILTGRIVYLAVKNGFNLEVDKVDTIKFKKGDILPFSSDKCNINKRLKSDLIPIYNDKLTLRVILSYQENDFLQKEKDKFFNTQYLVSNESNRMGYKVNGEVIQCQNDSIISEAIAFGSIQIPPDGQPIILLKDRQTIGGYPKIGVVLDVDCFKLSQMQPNTQVNFKEISFEEALKISKKFFI